MRRVIIRIEVGYERFKVKPCDLHYSERIAEGAIQWKLTCNLIATNELIGILKFL